MKEKIERLASINSANSMIGISDEMRDERQIIVNYLKVMDVIEVGERKGDFHFIGEKADEYKEIYLYQYENF